MFLFNFGSNDLNRCAHVHSNAIQITVILLSSYIYLYAGKKLRALVNSTNDIIRFSNRLRIQLSKIPLMIEIIFPVINLQM